MLHVIQQREKRLGPVSMKFEKEVKGAVSTCFFAAKPRIIFETKELFPATKKNVSPTQQQSNVIYEFSCHCIVGMCSVFFFLRFGLILKDHFVSSKRLKKTLLMWVVHPKGCNTESTNMFQSQSEMQAQPRNARFHYVLASNLSHVLNIVMKIDSAFSSEVVPAFTFLF